MIADDLSLPDPAVPESATGPPTTPPGPAPALEGGRQTDPPLGRKLLLLGTTVIVALAILAMCSYALTQYAPREKPPPGKIHRLSLFIAALPIPPKATEVLREGLLRRGWFRKRPGRVMAFLAPMFVATLATLAATWLLIRSQTVARSTVRTIHRIGIIVSVVALMAYPIFTQDVWLSVVWGRMVAAGVNPYATLAGPSALDGLPNVPPAITMTYGPLWAIVAGGIAFVGQKVVLVEYLLSKLVLFVVWLATLAVLRRVAERRSPRDAAIALCLVAWLPGPVWMTMAEGHNDIVMVLFLVGWLALVTGPKTLTGPLALTGAVAVKYMAAPLLVVDALYTYLTKRHNVAAYLKALALAAASIAVVFAPFAATGDFLSPLRSMQGWGWKFWTPAAAVTELSGALGRYVGLPITGPIFVVILGVVVAYQVRAFWRAPSPDTLIRVVLAVLCLETFALITHVWPWFLLWGLPFAVLAWRHWLGQAFLAIVVLSPILNLAWMTAPDWRYRGPLGIVLYGGAVFLMFLLVRSRIGLRIRSEAPPAWNASSAAT